MGRIDFIGQHPVWDGGRLAVIRAMGTVFAVNTDGTGFTTLHTFTETATELIRVPD